MKLSHLLSCTIQLVFGSSSPATRLYLFIYLFIIKEPTGIVCHAFEASSSRGCILLELEMIGFLTIKFKLFFRVAGFAHLLRIFSRFYPHF